MVFKNVELRLDVLQEELGLPLVFTRGFIQVRLGQRTDLRERVRRGNPSGKPYELPPRTHERFCSRCAEQHQTQ